MLETIPAVGKYDLDKGHCPAGCDQLTIGDDG